MIIVLAGNPNSGKTTLFNMLTGRSESVGNWAGVTVDRREASLRRSLAVRLGLETDVRVVDLPGAYSISPYSKEESITREYVTGENPDVLINVVDATAVERSLFFTTQLAEIGKPMVLALNKSDLARQAGLHSDLVGIAEWIGAETVEVTGTNRQDVERLLRRAVSLAMSSKKAETDGATMEEHSGLKTTAPFATETAASSEDGSATSSIVVDSSPERAHAGGEPDGVRNHKLRFGAFENDRARQDAVKAFCDRMRSEPAIRAVRLSDRLDPIVANAALGIPIFALIIWGIYSLAINGIGGWLSGWINDTLFGEIVPGAVSGFLDGIGTNPLLSALIVDGAIGGVGAVLGFLPLIMVLFFLLALLEDSGYMARVAVVMDRYFKRIGLSGKSIIPMIVGTGCSIPGVMSTRTIEDENDRRMTIMLTPFIPCSAKLPIIALFTAAFFPNATWMFPAVYLFAGLVIVAGGLLLKRIYRFDGQSAFIIELPEYKLPSLRYATGQMFRQAKAFIAKASTIILVMNTLVWLMQTYSWNLQPARTEQDSMLATVGGIFIPLLLPLGFAGWQLAAAALTGFIAKENVVSTLAIILAATDESLGAPGGVLGEWFTPVTALAFLAFNLFTPPCFAAIGAMNAELGRGGWLAKALAFQIGTGYVLAMLITQIGTPLVTGRPAEGLAASIVVLAALAALVAWLSTRKAKTGNIATA